MFDQRIANAYVRSAKRKLSEMQEELASVELLLANPEFREYEFISNVEGLWLCKKGLRETRKYLNQAIRVLLAQVDAAMSERKERKSNAD